MSSPTPSERRVKLLETYFGELDVALSRYYAHVRLRIIGSTALMLQSDYARGTKDLDVIETTSLDSGMRDVLRDLAGPGTTLAVRYDMYLDVVLNGIPFFPQQPTCHPMLDFDVIDLEVVDVVDVVVSKLKPFRSSDISDIEAMAERGLIDQDKLVQRFYEAMDFIQDSRGEELPRYARNLNTVERDILLVEETEIEMPSWLR